MQANQIEQHISQEQLLNMQRYLIGKIGSIPTHTPTELVSKFAEKRIMPRGSPRPGPWTNYYTPYLVEPMDNMGPLSPIQRDITMKAAQGGWTAATENVLGYYMKLFPADIMFLSATNGLLERWASRRLEPMITSFGIRATIAAIDAGDSSRKSGDKTFSKEYSGCRLDLASAQSPSSLRSSDKRILIRDEIDGAPRELTTGEGNFMKVSYVRTNAWGDRRKVMDLSTPKTYEDSLIWQEYLLGDQRIFLVPCPHCGGFQELRFGDPEKTSYGIKAEKKAGEFLYAYYQCEHCTEPIRDFHKESLLSGGYWNPTATPTDKTIASRHWSALYSPDSMVTFDEIYKRYIEALDEPGGMKSFRNLYLGLPYREKAERPKIEAVYELRGDYKEKTVPEGVLYLTMGMDVQRGKEDPRKKKPQRLEAEIVGHGRGYKTWSIDYLTIPGTVHNEHQGAWAKLDEMLREGEFCYKRKDGFVFEPRFSLIDSGHQYHTVLRFCERWSNIFPSKGFGVQGFDDSGKQMKKDDKGDAKTVANFKRYKLGRVQGGDILLVEVATNHYKRIVYGSLKIQRSEFGEDPPGFCNFPTNREKEYFKGLTAQVMRIDGSFHKTSIPDEPLDCRVLNLAGSDAWLDTRVDNLKKEYLKKGMTKQQVSVINKKTILRMLEKQTISRL